MDGTFDQLRPINVLISRLKRRNLIPLIYSIDLTAATDRLPIDLQEVVIREFFDRLEEVRQLPRDTASRLSVYWRNILVDRDYSLRLSKSKTINLRYSTGQPMGALSS